MSRCGTRLRFVPIIKLGELTKRLEYSKSANSLLSFFSPNHHSAVSNHDPWNGLATLMTLLETIVDTNKDYLSLQRKKGGYIAREGFAAIVRKPK